MHATLDHAEIDHSQGIAHAHTRTRSAAFLQHVDAACKKACDAIAPVWPLDRAIAVNPHWTRVGMPVRSVAARMGALANIQVFPSRDYLLAAWNEGRITTDDLQRAIDRIAEAKAAGITVEQWATAMHTPPALPQLPLLIDVLDNDPMRHTRLSWRQAITHQVSQTCAAFFDDYQGEWRPENQTDLYAFWRNTLQHDHGIGLLMGIPDLGKHLHSLPATRAEAECWVLERLGLPPSVWVDYLEAMLLTVNGWASWCAYLGWQAKLEGSEDHHLRELLAIRLAWGAVVLEARDNQAAQEAFSQLQQVWQHAPVVLQEAERALLLDEVGQLALEIAYQRDLTQRLAYATNIAPSRGEIEVQAAFCIDVRSEPLRRALEAAWPGVQTIGFAGFFGLPVAYTPLASQIKRPQLPGLLAPALEVTDEITAHHSASDDDSTALREDAIRARRNNAGMAASWHAASRWPGATFSYVEAAGFSYLGKLGEWLRPSSRPRQRDDLDGLPSRYRQVCRPMLAGVDLATRTDIAARVIQGMGLTRFLAPLVVLVGHGSQSANNAHAAALDCGACCGQTGEVNARVLARLLNEAAVRQQLHERGLIIPPTTTFVAALHNTTTDEIEGFDLNDLPIHASARWEKLQAAFVQAGDQVRRERAPKLGLNPRASHNELLMQLRRRANDGAETRPEFGLAGNAAFIIAPRHRSQGCVLQGRTFLHDYDATLDPSGALLEQLMTAPMLVTHWINWQYHASLCDPLHLGSGNKVLHNVVGGHIGVFEGNGGDLRVGLSRQSLHNGEDWVHEPLRLTVVIDAPAEIIEAVLHKHANVAHLVTHQWLHLMRFTENGLAQFVQGAWQPVL